MIVLDASIMAAWLLEEPSYLRVNALFDHLETEPILVPAHWPNEVGNALRRAVRSRRLQREEIAPLVKRMAVFGINVAAPPALDDIATFAQLALQHNLSVYDAVYVRLAALQQIPLATLDEPMKAAARKLGVDVLPS